MEWSISKEFVCNLSTLLHFSELKGTSRCVSWPPAHGLLLKGSKAQKRLYQWAISLKKRTKPLERKMPANTHMLPVFYLLTVPVCNYTLKVITVGSVSDDMQRASEKKMPFIVYCLTTILRKATSSRRDAESTSEKPVVHHLSTCRGTGRLWDKLHLWVDTGNWATGEWRPLLRNLECVASFPINIRCGWIYQSKTTMLSPTSEKSDSRAGKHFHGK